MNNSLTISFCNAEAISVVCSVIDRVMFSCGLEDKVTMLPIKGCGHVQGFRSGY